MSWYDFVSKPIDYSRLPEDCFASAAERLRVALRKRECPNIRDLHMVLGEPNGRISLPISHEEAREYFLRNRG